MLVRAVSEEPVGEHEDETSVEAVQAGDRRAFDELARAYRSRLFGVCYRYTGNSADAEDLVQEVLLRAYRGLAGFRGEARFRTWLYRIAVNACLNWIAGSGGRAAAMEPLVVEVPDAAPMPDEGLSERQTASRVRRAVSRLPERQRLTLLLRIYEELTYREIAEIMGCRVGTAKANLFFALSNLRKQLEGEGAPLGFPR